jgi:hypothetical protein
MRSNFFGSSNLRLPEILQQRVSQAQQKSFTFVTIKLLVATVAQKSQARAHTHTHTHACGSRRHYNRNDNSLQARNFDDGNVVIIVILEVNSATIKIYSIS